MGVLAGSIGRRSDSRDLVRGVLFILEDAQEAGTCDNIWALRPHIET